MLLRDPRANRVQVPNVKAESKDEKKDEKRKTKHKKTKSKSKRRHRHDLDDIANSITSRGSQGKHSPSQSVDAAAALRYESSEDPHESLLPSPTSGSALVARQRRATLRTGIAEQPETDIEAGDATSEDDGPFSRGRDRQRNTAGASASKVKPYTLEPLRDSPAGPRSASSAVKDGRSPETAKSRSSAFGRKSTASTTMSKLIKQETDKDEEVMRKSLEGMLEKKTYIGLVRCSASCRILPHRMLQGWTRQAQCD